MKNILLPVIILAMLASCGDTEKKKTVDESAVQKAVWTEIITAIEKDKFLHGDTLKPGYEKVLKFDFAYKSILKGIADGQALDETKKQLIDAVKALCEGENAFIPSAANKMISKMEEVTAVSDVSAISSYVLQSYWNFYRMESLNRDSQSVK